MKRLQNKHLYGTLTARSVNSDELLFAVNYIKISVT